MAKVGRALGLAAIVFFTCAETAWSEQLSDLSVSVPNRALFVSKSNESGGLYRLNLVEKDSRTPKTLIQSKFLIASPSWSPDGESIAYTYAENGETKIGVIALKSDGMQETVLSFEGGSPAWSPDGTRLAFSKISNGNTDIYVRVIANGQLTRVTDVPGIDTEAKWSPDGEKLFFVSDRSGKPQVYIMSLQHTNAAKRLTSEVEYSSSPDVSSDGRLVALAVKSRKGFLINVMDLETGIHKSVSRGPLDQQPVFLPDGQLISYRSQSGPAKTIEIVDLDGVSHRSIGAAYELREFAWAP